MRPAPVLSAALAVAALAAVTGCGAGHGEDPAPDPGVISAGAAIRLVDETDANVTLMITNQSFDDEEIQLEVTIDGITVVDGDFHVEGQHNVVSYPLAVRPGSHELTAESDDFDEALHETFVIPQGKERHALIEHWTRQGAAHLDWRFQRLGFQFD